MIRRKQHTPHEIQAAQNAQWLYPQTTSKNQVCSNHLVYLARGKATATPLCGRPTVKNKKWGPRREERPNCMACWEKWDSIVKAPTREPIARTVLAESLGKRRRAAQLV